MELENCDYGLSCIWLLLAVFSYPRPIGVFN